MTEAEAVEIAAIYIGNCIQAVGLSVTFTFGYLAVCFKVGSQLSKFEAIGITCLYLFASVTCYISFMNNNRFYAIALEHAAGIANKNPYSLPSFWDLSNSILFCITTIASLGYMWRLRQLEAHMPISN